MTTEERRRKAILLAKDYPMKIRTACGKYLMPVMTFHKDRFGMPFNQQITTMAFDSLADAVECGIRWREARHAR